MATPEPLDLAAISEKWLNQCASCDAGLLAGCTCSQEDYRPTMLNLVREVERLQAKADEQGAALRRVHQAIRENTTAAAVALAMCRIGDPGVPSILDERDEALAEVERLRGQIESERHEFGAHKWLHYQVCAQLDKARSELERLRGALAKSRNYRPSGHCRGCGQPEGAHRMYCQLYVGPLTHSWVSVRENGTFGGADHHCSCGGWFRQGGLAGHGDGTPDAEPVCPNVAETYRGGNERPDSPVPAPLTSPSDPPGTRVTGIEYGPPDSNVAAQGRGQSPGGAP